MNPTRFPSTVIAVITSVCWLINSGHCAAGNAGELSFESEAVRAIVKPAASSTEITFRFENKSEDMITIERLSSPCGCIKAALKDGKMNYQSGEKGEITALFNIGNFFGTVEKKVVAWLEGDQANKPSIVLTAQITIPELISITPKSLVWKSGSPAESKNLKITILEGQNIQVLRVATTNNHYQHELKTIREGQEYEIEVTPRDTKTAGIAILKITTDSDISRFKRIQGYAMTKMNPQTNP